MSVGCGVLIGGAVMLSPASLRAQQKGPPPKRGQAIEIRGQVPTPQVVTVRPREVPAYDRQILSPAFYDGTGTTASAGGVQVVPESQVRGTTALDTIPVGIAREGGRSAGAGCDRACAIAGEGGFDSKCAGGGGRARGCERGGNRVHAARARGAPRASRLAAAGAERADADAGGSGKRRRGGETMSAADSAARAQEIESIRRELEYRRQRLDSLQREVRAMGRPRKKPVVLPKSTTPDTTVAPPTPPRGRRLNDVS